MDDYRPWDGLSLTELVDHIAEGEGFWLAVRERVETKIRENKRKTEFAEAQRIGRILSDGAWRRHLIRRGESP
jgi:hypothetical protein